MININLYIDIAITVFIILLIKYLISDREIMCLPIIIADFAEALTVSIGWIYSLPIMVISKIAIEIIFLFLGDEEND